QARRHRHLAPRNRRGSARARLRGWPARGDAQGRAHRRGFRAAARRLRGEALRRALARRPALLLASEHEPLLLLPERRVRIAVDRERRRAVGERPALDLAHVEDEDPRPRLDQEHAALARTLRAHLLAGDRVHGLAVGAVAIVDPRRIAVVADDDLVHGEPHAVLDDVLGALARNVTARVAGGEVQTPAA